MIRVLVIDDSAMVRQILSKVLSADPAIEVVGSAPDPFVGRDLIVRLEPDVITLDVEMPRMDGITFLQKLMQYKPLPVLILSSLTPAGGELALKALNAGAIDVILKPKASYSLAEVSADLIAKIKAAKEAKVGNLAPALAVRTTATHPLALARASNKLLAIGASTGGTRALELLLRAMPKTAPGTVIVQHMPENFTRAFAQRLDEKCDLQVKEAENGDVIAAGKVYIAPGNQHMLIARAGAYYRVQLKKGPRVRQHRPSVDVLFKSAAAQAGANAIGVVLTGMGDDGAQGLLAMRKKGAVTLAQDEASCVVFGMPKAAIEIHAAQQVLPLQHLAATILSLADKKAPEAEENSA